MCIRDRVSVVMGMALTAPISSAAIAISLDLSGLAAGAATVGCCVNMLGFAVASYRENGVGGLISQGLGTSMLQVPNIVRKPVIWLPEIIVSAILGPLSTTLFAMTNNAMGAGMGTSGLVDVYKRQLHGNDMPGSVVKRVELLLRRKALLVDKHLLTHSFCQRNIVGAMNPFCI